MSKIIPAILTSDLETVNTQLAELKTSDHLEQLSTVQIDIIDGEFAPDVTVTPIDIGQIDFTPFQLDFHLMTNEPVDFIWEIFDEAQLPVRAVTAQIERLPDPLFFLEQVKSHQFLSGFSLNLYTPVEEINPDWFAQGLKIIQFMGVDAGAQGQVFNPLVVDKFRQFLTDHAAAIKEHQLEIAFDGGLNPDHIQSILDATPAELHPQLSFAVGSFLWQKSPHLADALEQLLNVI